MTEQSVISKNRCIGLLDAAGISLTNFTVSDQIIWNSAHGFESEVNSFIDRSLVRISVLLDDTSALVVEDRLLGAAATARASLETMAVIVEFFRRFKSAVKIGNGDEVRRVLGAFIFASVEFSDVSGQKTPNVMDAIRNADKQQAGALRVYGILCEVVHPNWSGRLHEGRDKNITWNAAAVQRLIVAISITASFADVVVREFSGFGEFVQVNRKNIKNAIFF
jgi:hypothetical protein